MTDDEIREAIEEVKLNHLQWGSLSPSSRAHAFWTAFESENQHRLPLVLRLSEVLATIPESTIDSYYLIYIYSKTDNIQGTLDYYWKERCQTYADSLDNDADLRLEAKKIANHFLCEYLVCTDKNITWYNQVTDYRREADKYPGDAQKRNEVKSYFALTVEHNPGTPGLLHRYSSFLTEYCSEYDTAAEYAHNAISLLGDCDEEKKPELALAYAALADSLQGQGQLAEAVRMYIRATQLNPYSARLHQRMGYTLLRVNQVLKAREEFQKAISIDPYSDENAYKGLVVMQVFMGDLEEAMKILDQQEQHLDDSYSSHYNRACVFARKAEAGSAINELTKIIGNRDRYRVSRDFVLRKVRGDSDFAWLIEGNSEFRDFIGVADAVTISGSTPASTEPSTPQKRGRGKTRNSTSRKKP